MANMITLTPDQFDAFNRVSRGYTSGLNGTPIGPENSPTGYSVSSDDYGNAYSKLQSYGAIGRGGGDFPNPASFAEQAAPQAAPFADTAGIKPLGNIQKAPTYAQFAASQGNGGAGAPAGGASPVYNGGAAPAGMNAADAQILQNIYKKSVGGFVPASGFGAPPQEFADGGAPSSSEMSSWVTRREASDAVHSNGLFNSSVPGRTDKLDTLVPAGAYVVPADVVSGLGEGNTMAGSNILDKMFSTGPFGMKLRNPGHGGVGIPGIPGAPHRQVPPATRAEGGATPTRIIAAGGEYLIHPDAVKNIGGGDMNKGHKILDHFVVHARKKTAAEMNKLPGPKK